MGSTRRSLLKKGLIGGGLLAVSGIGLSLQPGRQAHAPQKKLKVLTAETYGILLAVIAHVLPAAKGFPSTDEIEVAERVDALLYKLHPADAQELLQALQIMENPVLGLLLDGRLQPFSAAAPKVQKQTLENWKTSRLAVRRSGYVALSGLIKSSYFAHPKTYASVGYPGPPNYSQAPSPQKQNPALEQRVPEEEASP